MFAFPFPLKCCVTLAFPPTKARAGAPYFRCCVVREQGSPRTLAERCVTHFELVGYTMSNEFAQGLVLFMGRPCAVSLPCLHVP